MTPMDSQRRPPRCTSSCFPREVRPRTLITRDRDEIKAFAKEEGRCVLKPMQGSGGTGVFLVQEGDIPNLNQMIDAVSRDGFVIAQEYLPAAEQGDMRLFVMNGRPLRVKGKYAAFRRTRSGGDMRSNIHAGGKLAEAVVDQDCIAYRGDRTAQTRSGRHVSRWIGHRRRQTDGDQCLQSGRVRQRPEIHKSKLHQVRDLCSGA